MSTDPSPSPAPAPSPSPAPAPSPSPSPSPAPAPSPSPAPAPAPAPAPSPSPNDQGWWRSPDHGFDADTVKYLDGKNFPDLKTALSSARQADEMARNRNVVGKPDPNNLKGWGGYTELGWNPDRQAYTIEAPKLADGEVHDEKAFGKFADLAHDARLAPWQAKAVYDGMHAHENAQLKAFRDAGAVANRELDNKLRGNWGDKYDERTTIAKRAFAFFKPDSVTGAQMDQAMGSPAMVELFERIGAAMGEDKLVGQAGGSFGAKTPAQARSERLALENDKEWFAVFNNPRHPQNAAFVKQRSDLMEIEARK
ncbi:hypothetical protein [Bradyrhizobium sp. 76]|uniref:hypothetical protein n=1 Tax=Bradyrhizobium sp. 76 TaxID=2782680 RepID=UPI001FFC1E97|nr:hypothetical protein [Bradyrhizobium sp. 76]MCK1407651.1 hypothetical protein [Bradyrhizobium sp. 76]